MATLVSGKDFKGFTDGNLIQLDRVNSISVFVSRVEFKFGGNSTATWLFETAEDAQAAYEVFEAHAVSLGPNGTFVVEDAVSNLFGIHRA